MVQRLINIFPQFYTEDKGTKILRNIDNLLPFDKNNVSEAFKLNNAAVRT
jgi:hypothetical protein